MTPPRRWFRFSLRTMLVVVTLACVAVAIAVPLVKAYRLRQQQEAMRPFFKHMEQFEQMLIDAAEANSSATPPSDNQADRP